MSEAFAHLHVASGFSLRYGASTPATLVERAAAQGQPALALTDRDGLYGAVRFVQACDEAGIAPVLGVDLAVAGPASTGLSSTGLLPAHRLSSTGLPPPAGHPPAARRVHPACQAPSRRLGLVPRRCPHGAGSTRCVAASRSTRVTPASPSSPADRPVAPPPVPGGGGCAAW